MLAPVGRLAVLLLVLIVVALGARVLFVDSRSPDELDPHTGLPTQTIPAVLPQKQPTAPEAQPAPADPLEAQKAQEARQAHKKTTVVDPDPDLDQTTEPADCQGTPEQPGEPKPEPPAPH